MNRLFCNLLIACLIICAGCSNDEPNKPTIGYSAKHLWLHGTNPIPSPSGEEVLFIQEELLAGLYLLKDSTATSTNSNVSVRSDYGWSRSGEYYCYSVAGAEGGIFIQSKTSGSVPVRIWNLGSHPRFLSGDTLIVCAGPEDGGAFEGLWQINVTDSTRLPLISHGVSPEVSPDGRKIAFLMTTGSSSGRMLMVYNWQEQYLDTVGLNALNFTWLGNSQSLVYESSSANIPHLIKTRIGTDPPGQFLGISGSNPRGFGSDDMFYFTEIFEDSLVGIYLGDINGGASEVFPGGSNAGPVNEDRVFAQTPDGLYELSK